jgi:uracil-DNA glycosylase
LGKHAHEVCVPTVEIRPGALSTEGPVILAIAQNPGAEEDAAGVPLIGPSGERFREVYAGPLLRRHPSMHLYATNAIRCGPEPCDAVAIISKCFPHHTLPDVEAIWTRHFAPRLIGASPSAPDSRLCIWCLGGAAARAVSEHILGKPMTLRDLIRAQPIDAEWKGIPVTVFATLHPVLYDRSRLPEVVEHVKKIDRWLRAEAPPTIEPTIVEPAAPTADSPRVISLDIETYGLVSDFPKSTSFIAPVAIATDGVAPADLVHTVSITGVNCPCPMTHTSKTYSSCPRPASKGSSPTSRSSSPDLPKCLRPIPKQTSTSPLCVSTPTLSGAGPKSPRRYIDLPALSSAWPMDTMIFVPRLNPLHARLVTQWLNWADTIIGFQLLYDLSWLRASRLQWCEALSTRRHQIIDATILANLDNEKREERGLEALACLLLGIDKWKPDYDEKLPADHPTRILHNARDSHITACLAIELAKRLTT